VSIHWHSALANTFWGATSVKAWRRLRAALSNPAEVQQRMLFRYIRRNAETAFGVDNGFRSIRSIRDFQDRVPLRTYDEIEPLTRRIQSGEGCVLTRSPVERLVPSSGSTAPAKLVPFTADLRHEFSRAIDAWVLDLFMGAPRLAGGRAYWSITPAAAFDTDPTPPARGKRAAVPVGFEDDSRYLGGSRQLLAGAVMAVPLEVGRLHDLDAFRYATALFLLHAGDLRLISVWHPSFLERLIDTIAVHYDRLLHDMARGSLTPPYSIEPEVAAKLLPLLGPNRRRADLLRRVGPHNVRAIWPELALVSCWADGPARGAAAHLATRCPGVRIQPKGLLASEGVVTIPIDSTHPLAITSHFFEFEGPDGRISLAHELERGCEYSVVLTTGGGLYRYRLGDRVRVDDVVGRTPSVRFVGRDDRVSDWFGEKLSEGFVACALESLFAGMSTPRFAMLAPELTSNGLAYTLFVDAEGPDDVRLAEDLDRLLQRNPHYRWCVDLQQLKPARVVRVGAEATQAYIDACVARGQRLGDIKPALLRSETGWASVLRPSSHLTSERRIGCRF